MPPSRAAANAKMAKRYQRKHSLTQAKSIGTKFTEKQSHFERRREEEQVRSAHQQRGTSFPTGGELSSGDGMLGNKDAWRRQDQQLSSFSSGATEAPSPFELASRGKKMTSPLDTKAFTTQSSATFGMGSRPMPRAASSSTSSGAMAASGEVAMSLGTRSTRRVARFNLGSGPEGGSDAPQGGLLGAALGQRRTRAGDDDGSPSDGIDHLLGGDGADEPARKLTREERFKEVVSNSRSHRVQLQRERAERDAETNALDQEINALLHLLPKRDKEEEERAAFARSGTPAVRALLQSYKENHVAKRLTVKSTGDYAVTELMATKDGISGKDRGELKTAGSTVADAGLDARSLELLARIRKGTVRSAEEEESGAMAGGGGTGAREDSDPRRAKEEAPTYAEDDFDAMLNQMRLDTRRAHAADRMLDEEEEAELAAQQLLLEEDRRTVPALGLAEKDQMQFSRGEWVRRGGDEAFHMDGEAGGDAKAACKDGVYEDNVDIPSSYEGDSDGDEDAASVDEQAYVMDDGADDDMPLIANEDEDDPTAAATTAAVPSRSIVGSVALDHLLSELEALATSGDDVAKLSAAQQAQTVEQRQKQFMKLLLQLHHYAKSHVLEVANIFRLILIEAERTFLRSQRRAISKPMMLSLVVVANLFPMSDYRHEVSTPFYIFLCSTLMQMKLDSLECVHCYVGLCALLTQSVRSASGKFVGEAIAALLNVLALQLPRSAIEPARYQGLRLPIPVMERGEAPLLACTGSTESTTTTTAAPPRWQLLEAQHDPEQLLLCAFHQLTVLADLYSTMPAFPVAMLEPFSTLDTLLTKHWAAAAKRSAVSARVQAAHESLKALLTAYATSAEDHRAPLAMRTFRPRPIRLFEPLLEEREESAVKTELRVIKRDIREDKKRVMRQLTAEATVQRRAREKEQSETEAQREKRMHQVMGALQQQQHMMNTVDAIMAKAKSKSKKGISGAPAQSSGGGGGEGGQDM